jgi:hypothetical protein
VETVWQVLEKLKQLLYDLAKYKNNSTFHRWMTAEAKCYYYSGIKNKQFLKHART